MINNNSTVIPVNELERINSEAILYSESEFDEGLYRDTAYIAYKSGKESEYLRQFSPSHAWVTNEPVCPKTGSQCAVLDCKTGTCQKTGKKSWPPEQVGQALESIPSAKPAKESQPDIDIVKLLKWVAKVAPPEFREEKPHTLKGWRFDGKLLSTEQVSRLFFKSAGANSSRPEPPEAPEDKKAHAIEFAKWINNSWYTPHYAKWIHLREGLAGMKTAEELYDIFQMEAAPAPDPEPSEQSQPDAFLDWLDEEIGFIRDDDHPSDRLHRQTLKSVREKYLSVHARPA